MTTGCRHGRWLATGFALLGVLMTAPRPSAAATDPEEVDRLIQSWKLPRAREAVKDIASAPARDLRLGMIALHEGRYRDAEGILAALVANAAATDGLKQRAMEYLTLARGNLRAMGSGRPILSPDGKFSLTVADPKDAILAPYLFQALAAARTVLEPELSVQAPDVVRFEILDDPAKLALVTPLTLENIKTTGTVGITKHYRVVMVTPRVMVYGYGWLDTAVHEYVHYLLSLRTNNRSPVWLQEGLAKLFEQSWRLSGDPPLDDAVAALLRKAVEQDDLVTFDEMYPSVAMLPSQERAALAYAEVETMLAFLLRRRGRAAMSRLLDAVATGSDPTKALADAWGASFEDFMADWKKDVLRRTRGAVAEPLAKLQWKDGSNTEPGDDPLGDVFSELGGGRARKHARLGALLQSRDHDRAAVLEYEKARRADARARKDPALSRRLGETYLALGEYQKAVLLLQVASDADADNANIAASLTTAAVESGNLDLARKAAARAVRQNPFIPWLHCDLAKLAQSPARASEESALCRPR